MDLLRNYNKQMKPIRDIVGVAMEVYNEWGCGLLESAYETGMEHVLKASNHIVERQKLLPMYWKGEKLDDYYRMDLVVDDIIVELKVCKFISHEHRQQLHNYMRLTQNTYGLLINFTNNRVYSEAYKLFNNGEIEKVDLQIGYCGCD